MAETGAGKTTPMKTFTPQRTAVSSGVHRSARRSTFTREQLPLRSLPDCLLAAYDEVSHRAFERFVTRGSNSGNELADWRAAENELFSPVDVDFEESQDILYALASVTQRTGTQIEVAIEDHWLLIWAHAERVPDCAEGVRRLADQESSGLDLKWIDWEEVHDILQGSEDCSEIFENDAGARAEDEPWELAGPVMARSFCVVELPAAVDISRSSAVLSDGLIAIRMPKMKIAAPELAES
jgi:Protein of unknown function (DUF2934)